jgi:DNA-binding transcriptional MerR regulator
MSGIWRIEELTELAARALELTPSRGQPSGRGRDVPDVRTIRYYTTIGLMDRPAQMRGRTAFYGPHHLRQLVAVKRLQAQGMSLLEVQASLAGASAKRLDQLAELPPGFIQQALAAPSAKREPPPEATPDDDVARQAPVGSRTRFWSAVPEVAASNAEKADARPERGDMAPQPAVILPLDGGVSLVLEGVTSEQVTPEVVASLQPAAAALCDALVRSGLCRRREVVDKGPFDQHRTN